MTKIRALAGVWLLWMLAMIGCNSDKKAPEATPAPAGSGSGTVPAVAVKPKPGTELNLFAWSEYVPQALIDGFTKETGIKVNYETFATNEEMVAKLLAGSTKYDLIQPSDYTAEALIKQKKLLALDKSNIPNEKNIDAEYRNLPFDPGLKHCIPWMVGTVGIVVNTEKIKDPIKGYKDVFQAKYKQKIVVVDDSRELVTWALSTQGVGPNDVTAESLVKVKPVLADWIKLVKAFNSDSPKTVLLGGDAHIGIVWSGEAARLYKEDKKYQYVLPEEGAHMFVDSLCVPSGAKNKIGAEMFVDYVLRPEVSKLISDEFFYTNPNSEARKLLTKEQLENPASYPPPGKRDVFRDIGKLASDIDKLVTDLKAAAAQ